MLNVTNDETFSRVAIIPRTTSRTFGTAPGLITARVITIKLISLVISSRYSRPAGTRILDYYKIRDYRPEGASVPLLAIGAITNAFTSVNEPHCIPIFSPLPRSILLISSFFLPLSFYFSLSLLFVSRSSLATLQAA